LDAIKEDQEFENRIKAAADGRSRYFLLVVQSTE
jgi:hypothetical protein